MPDFSLTQAPSILRMPGNLHLPSSSRLGTLDNGKPAVNAALFLDRDGVLVQDNNHLTNPDDMVMLHGAAEAIRSAQERYYIVVVTNQSGIARGILDEETLLEIHSRLVVQLWNQGAIIDALFYCPHLVEGAVKSYSIECDCRKPKPGMLIKTGHDWSLDLPASHIVGDQNSDAEAGEAVGASSILLGVPDPGAPPSRRFAKDLPDAMAQILVKDQTT